MNMIKVIQQLQNPLIVRQLIFIYFHQLYGKPIRVNKASRDKKTLDVGANLFVGNLDPDVDEKLLYDTFSAFGVCISTRIMMGM